MTSNESIAIKSCISTICKGALVGSMCCGVFSLLGVHQKQVKTSSKLNEIFAGFWVGMKFGAYGGFVISCVLPFAKGDDAAFAVIWDLRKWLR